MGADKCAKRYRGKGARDYEAKRAHKSKWILEAQGVETLLPGEVKTVLDVPVGTGRFQSLYQQRGIKATGVDTSPDMLAEVKAKGMTDLHLMDARHLDFGARGFDAIVCVRLFPWFEPGEVAQTMLQFARLSDTWIVSIRTNWDRPLCKNGSLWNHYHPDFLHWVQDAGFRVDQTFPVGGKGYALHRILRAGQCTCRGGH